MTAETIPPPRRVWFYKPEWYWYGWKSLRPFWFGDDEWHRKTLVLGWNPTGQIIIALWHFKTPCECTDEGDWLGPCPSCSYMHRERDGSCPACGAAPVDGSPDHGGNDD